VIKSKRIRWNVARIAEMYAIFWLEKLKGRVCLEELSVKESITIKWILGKYGGRLWTECIWFSKGTSGRP